MVSSEDGCDCQKAVLAMSARDPDYPTSGLGLSSNLSRWADSELRMGTDPLGLILR